MGLKFNSLQLAYNLLNQGSTFCSMQSIRKMASIPNIAKAIRVETCGGPEVMRVANVSPPKPSNTQVQVKVKAAGVNPVDTYIRSGVYPVLPKLPYTPGSDFAGTVTAVGNSVTNLKVGDRVYSLKCASGSYAEYCVADQSFVYNLHPRLSFPQGASIGIAYFTAHRALFKKCHVKKNDTVLIHGASGGVGVAAVQLAKSVGATVLGTAGTEAGLKFVKKQGAEEAFNHRDPDYISKIMEYTGNKGLDVVIEMLANVNLVKDMDMMAIDGRIAIVGSRGTIEVNPRAAMGKEASIHGVQLQRTTDEELSAMAEDINQKIASEHIQPVVGKVYSLSEAAEAHQEVIEHKDGSHGKIIIMMD